MEDRNFFHAEDIGAEGAKNERSQHISSCDDPLANQTRYEMNDAIIELRTWMAR